MGELIDTIAHVGIFYAPGINHPLYALHFTHFIHRGIHLQLILALGGVSMVSTSQAGLLKHEGKHFAQGHTLSRA